MQKLFMEESLMVLIAKTRRHIKQRVWEQMRPFDLTPQQTGVILVLTEQSELTLKDLAARIWCDAPTASRIVKKLCSRSLVRVVADARDGRKSRLVLSAAGQRVGAQVAARANALARQLERGLSRSEVNALRQILRRIIANVAD